MDRHGPHGWDWTRGVKISLVFSRKENVKETIVLSEHAYCLKSVKVNIAEFWFGLRLNMCFIKLHASEMSSDMVWMVWHSSIVKGNDCLDINTLLPPLKNMILNLLLHDLRWPYPGSIFAFFVINDLVSPKALLSCSSCHFDGTLFAKAVIPSIA